jgi:hypothetical protein
MRNMHVSAGFTRGIQRNNNGQRLAIDHKTNLCGKNVISGNKRRRGSAVNIVSKNILVSILGATTLSLMLGVEPSKAIEPLKVYRGVLVLEGTIVAGDYDKFREFLGTKSNFDKISGGVFLASPGGNVAEAMRMGRLIRALRLTTDVPSGPPSGIPKYGESLIKPNHLVNPRAYYLCASACFFVYVAGIYRNLSWVGRLGIHRPSQLQSNARALSNDEVLQSNWFVREVVKNYLKEMSVPDKYVDLIFSVAPNEMRWITQSEFDSDLQGFYPELRHVVAAKCDRQPSEEKIKLSDLRTTSSPLEKARASEIEEVFSVPAKRLSETGKCWAQIKAELPIEAWHKVFDGK